MYVEYIYLQMEYVGIYYRQICTVCGEYIPTNGIYGYIGRYVQYVENIYLQIEYMGIGSILVFINML